MYYDPFESNKETRSSKYITAIVHKFLLLFNLMLGKRTIKVSAWVKYRNGKLLHTNFGDDLNILFLKRISQDYFVSAQSYAIGQRFWHRDAAPMYYFIGSCFHLINTGNAYVWGSGMLTSEHLPLIKPHKILAVRGPLTRRELIQHGIDCPEVYGDPALLLPYYYQPSSKHKKYRLGIVPHYVDFDKSELRTFVDDDSVLIIRVSGYQSWRDVIDDICSCDCIASSSLHGLIVAEAYQIPNVWAEIREPLIGDENRRFKFHDFFLSTGKDRVAPYVITEATRRDDIIRESSKWISSSFSVKKLVESCPFRLKSPIKPFI